MSVNKLKIKNCCLIFLIFLLTIIVGSNEARAHEVESNNEVSALLHIYPNDAPVAGEKDQMEFTFWDSERTFALSKCDCTVKVLDGDSVVFSSNLATKSAEKYTQKTLVDFVFPHEGFFKVVLNGSSKGEIEEFADFELEYTATVS